MKYKMHKNNFDLIRLILALVVFLVHSATLSKSDIFLSVAKYLNSGYAVYSFFIISGFLIFKSYENDSKSLKSFFKKRFLRIYPGYFFVVVITSVLLFSISNVNFYEYLNGWIKYLFANLLTLNFLQPTLPGVFENNPIHAVNGSLWTIKLEIMFYFSVPLIGWLFFKFKKFRLFIFVILYSLSVLYKEGLIEFSQGEFSSIYATLAKQFPGQLAFFLSGAYLYYYFQHFQKYQYIYLFFAIVGIAVYYLKDIYVLLPFSLSIIVIYFALIFPYLGNFGKYGDFSFGIYIWHFPIVQVFVYFHILEKNPIMGSIALSFSVFLVAFLSWKYIEKPFLEKKSHYIQVEKY